VVGPLRVIDLPTLLPLMVAHRAACVTEGRCQLDDPVLQNFTRLMLKK
jgi:hypothetical protein